ncbi:5-hydroxytryptamine receptor 1-like isoform X1 [Homarus americanus]|uniref:5-hydroxytryptamine receptor 1-like isoform X1 n=1 Tax=Homarus americanus TaxID=6706 RepID=UPI001C45431C|nr:5-hydroxytryptamine receptor 1-like isoform X1 [Homarus americanus]XP_042236733.1 5-hydroxytryptamine receptor 1-like isoform X1 [Homarus americanus]XP_042236734.1 5-hydroxytryptamine receptor 1-like isoform X1 [Homarus americanus]
MLASAGVASPTPSLHPLFNISHAAKLILQPSEAAHTPAEGAQGPMVGTDSALVTVDPVNYTVLGDGGVETGGSALYMLFTTVLVVLVLLMIIVGTVVGNLLVCVAVCLVRKLRRPYNYLLVSLAVSDLCVALLVMPMALLHELLGEWQFGQLACDVWVSFDVLSCTASILNLCMISVDRYLAITRPLEYGVKRTPRRMVAYIAFVWLGAAFISVPPILILGNEHGDGSICEVCQNFWYQIYATFGSFYIPLTVMVIVYYKIFCAAKRIVDEERKAQAHLRLVEEAEADARASTAVLGSYTQLKPVSRYSVVEVNNGGVETRLAPEAPPLSSKDETGSLLGPDSPHHLEDESVMSAQCGHKTNSMVPPRLVVCSSSVSSAASADSTTGSRWSLCETNGKAHPPNANAGARTPTQPQHGHNCYNACQSTNGSGTNGSPRKRSHPPKIKLKFALAKERKASTTLGIIMSAFVVCWLPFFVLALVRPFKKPSAIPAWISSLFLWLGYTNSLLNPIIYATLNKDFRKPFQEILCLRCASLNLLMREEFYHSQYGGPDTPTLSAVRTHTHTNPRNSSEIHLAIADPREASISEEAHESKI